MSDSYTTSLRIVQMPTGSNDTLWGVKADAAFAMLEQAIAGAISIDLTSAAGALTLSTANNASDQARNAAISFTGTPGATTTVTVPDVSKLTFMINNSNAPVIISAPSPGLSGALQPGQVGIVLTDGATNAYAFVIADVVGKGVLPQLYSTESL